MKVITKPAQMQKISASLIKKNKSIGFVPTMGALHDGHVSLIKKSVMSNDVTIVSIFVNPIQFGPKEDFSKYPRPILNDKNICKNNKVDFLFLPSSDMLYGKNYSTYVEVEKYSNFMCGASRAGHFKGVATVVSKLFNIVMADNAYFGLKDYQQYIIIKKMAEDLNIKTKVMGCPIVREKNGLAMSSRNMYLTQEYKEKASNIFKILIRSKKDFALNKDIKLIINNIKKSLNKIETAIIDYVEIRDYDTLEVAKQTTKTVVVAVAVKIQNVRLIDNIVCKK
ncbi:MAG: pantoate--beta-alanine ligase [Endomicrobiaceae bacterium]|nr:pantoate--beta-alanine ligase [Endomicrobiaceae bacterium]